MDRNFATKRSRQKETGWYFELGKGDLKKYFNVEITKLK